MPPFAVGNVVFDCWVQRTGLLPGEAVYVWRSRCRRIAAGRLVALCWARVDGVLIGREFASLKLATTTAAARLIGQEASHAA